VPTIGIGAGPWCDGQVLVFHDLLGLEDRVLPKFVRRYALLKADAVDAIAAFADDVRAGRFPGEDETYHLADDVLRALTGDGTNGALTGDRAIGALAGDGAIGAHGAEPRTA